MRRQYTRTPLPISALERMAQERLGLEEGTRCAVAMLGAKPLRKHGIMVGVDKEQVRELGQCPRYATRLIDGEPRCEAHGHRHASA